MSGFLYFLPGEQDSDLVKAANWIAARDKHGLSETLADVRDPGLLELRGVSAGPNSEAGVVVGLARNDGERPKEVGYFKDRQTWAKTFGSAWLGYGELPKSEWLARAGDSRAGRVAIDSFDRRWIIPVARRPGGKEVGPNLPTHVVYDANLKPTRAVRLDAIRLWEASGRVWDTFNEETDDPLTEAELETIALQAIAWHYRVGPAEINAYAEAGEPIIDSDTVQRFFLHLIDWDILAVRAPRKNDEAPTGSPSSTGSMDETPTGDPVEAS